MEAINSYVYRGQRPTPLPTPPPKRILTPAGNRLSTILENNSVGTRDSVLTNLSALQSQRHGTPPRESEEKSPPSYATDDGYGPLAAPPPDRVHQKLEALRLKSYRRGGWGRIVVIAIIVVVVLAIALGVGLGVGLKGGNSADEPAQENEPAQFPVGTYAINTYLLNTTAACVSQPETWACYPYTTYSQDVGRSATSFNWIISEAEDSTSDSPSYQISSADNPLSLVFANASLTLVDAGSDQERYTFTLPNVVKNVLPPISLTNDNSRATCYYNSTTITASLYTQIDGSLGNTTESGSNWPGGITLDQTVSGGEDVPNCYRYQAGGTAGEEIPLETLDTSSQCACEWANFERT